MALLSREGLREAAILFVVLLVGVWIVSAGFEASG